MRQLIRFPFRSAILGDRIPFSLGTLTIAYLTPARAWAHGRERHLEAVLPWTWDPWIVAPLALSVLIFLRGWLQLNRRATNGAPGLRRRTALFTLGWMSFGLALVSPLHAAGERSFLQHMIEHEILMLVATPLIVLAQPLPIFLWAFPKRVRHVLGHAVSAVARSQVWQALSRPIGATILQGAALWLWHAPALFDRALTSPGWHVAQHISFVVTAFLFWSAVLGGRGGGSPRVTDRALAAICLFATSLVGGALGALMAFSESPWYVAYAQLGMAPLGLTPAEDQQLAGLVMWLPGGLIHVIASLMLVHRLLKPVSSKALTGPAIDAA